MVFLNKLASVIFFTRSFCVLNVLQDPSRVAERRRKRLIQTTEIKKPNTTKKSQLSTYVSRQNFGVIAVYFLFNFEFQTLVIMD
jgi:hypothetical protein